VPAASYVFSKRRLNGRAPQGGAGRGDDQHVCRLLQRADGYAYTVGGRGAAARPGAEAAAGAV